MPTSGMDALEGFTLAPGFFSTSIACGLKQRGGLDLTLIASPTPCTAAGMFTTNRVKAAPVLLDSARLASGAASIRAVIANSGCANACTGDRGMQDARRMSALAAETVGCDEEQVLVLSTGVIGVPLDMDKVERGIAALADHVHAGARAPRGSAPPVNSGASNAHGDAARAIMTTDTRPKITAVDLDLDGPAVAIRGFAKGAGMIHPAMATMLAVLTTDVRAEPAMLDAALRTAVRASFNRVSVDGDMSTNDTVLLLASGASGVDLDTARMPAFTNGLTAACVSLAKQIARDGEGATRLVEVTVTGAKSEDDAHRAADRIACSPLVKTAIHGGDPNWGRILAAAGCSGAEFDPGRASLVFGPPNARVAVVAAGLPMAFDAATASERLRQDPVYVHLDLGVGDSSATVWTCDFSAEYVAINADYTT